MKVSILAAAVLTSVLFFACNTASETETTFIYSDTIPELSALTTRIDTAYESPCQWGQDGSTSFFIQSLTGSAPSQASDSLVLSKFPAACRDAGKSQDTLYLMRVSLEYYTPATPCAASGSSYSHEDMLVRAADYASSSGTSKSKHTVCGGTYIVERTTYKTAARVRKIPIAIVVDTVLYYSKFHTVSTPKLKETSAVKVEFQNPTDPALWNLCLPYGLDSENRRVMVHVPDSIPPTNEPRHFCVAGDVIRITVEND